MSTAYLTYFIIRMTLQTMQSTILSHSLSMASESSAVVLFSGPVYIYSKFGFRKRVQLQVQPDTLAYGGVRIPRRAAQFSMVRGTKVRPYRFVILTAGPLSTSHMFEVEKARWSLSSPIGLTYTIGI